MFFDRRTAALTVFAERFFDTAAEDARPLRAVFDGAVEDLRFFGVRCAAFTVARPFAVFARCFTVDFGLLSGIDVVVDGVRASTTFPYESTGLPIRRLLPLDCSCPAGATNSPPDGCEYDKHTFRHARPYTPRNRLSTTKEKLGRFLHDADAPDTVRAMTPQSLRTRARR